jgi:hypothetical protein
MNVIDLQGFLREMFPENAPVKMVEPIEPQFSFFKDDDGVWNLIEKGKVLGWINKINIRGVDQKYRAMSAVSYSMEWFYSLDAARCYLFEQSH